MWIPLKLTKYIYACTQQIDVSVMDKCVCCKNQKKSTQKPKTKTKRDQRKQTNNKIEKVYPNFLVFLLFEGIPVINIIAVFAIYTAKDTLLTKQFKRWDLFFFWHITVFNGVHSYLLFDENSNFYSDGALFIKYFFLVTLST